VSEHDRAAARRLRAAGQDADHRRLAGPVVAEQAEDLAGGGLQADAAERVNVTVILGQVLYLHRRGRRRGCRALLRTRVVRV